MYHNFTYPSVAGHSKQSSGGSYRKNADKLLKCVAGYTVHGAELIGVTLESTLYKRIIPTFTDSVECWNCKLILEIVTTFHLANTLNSLVDWL